MGGEFYRHETMIESYMNLGGQVQRAVALRLPYLALPFAIPWGRGLFKTKAVCTVEVDADEEERVAKI